MEAPLILKEPVTLRFSNLRAIFAEYFSTVYTPEQSKIYDEQFNSNIIQEYNRIKIQETQNSVDLPGGHITEKEVLDSIKLLKSKKAPGPDKIQSEHLLHGKSILSKYLCVLFNSIVKLGKIPAAWKQGFIVPIYKGGNK